tara:strand:- start:66 stop:257 length:192 start_codon:yes stop_codon:yes gene_type:complete
MIGTLILFTLMCIALVWAIATTWMLFVEPAPTDDADAVQKKDDDTEENKDDADEDGGLNFEDL